MEGTTVCDVEFGHNTDVALKSVLERLEPVEATDVEDTDVKFCQSTDVAGSSVSSGPGALGYVEDRDADELVAGTRLAEITGGFQNDGVGLHAGVLYGFRVSHVKTR